MAFLFAAADKFDNCCGLFKISLATVFLVTPFLTCDFITSCPAFLKDALVTIPPIPAPSKFTGSRIPTPKFAKKPEKPLPPSS